MNHDPTPPRAIDLLPVLLIASVLTPVAWWVTRSKVTLPVFAAFSIGSAALLGVPLLFWALDHAWARLKSYVLLGATAGAVPMIAVLASGVLGRLMRGGLPYLERVLARGAPIPVAGLMTWPQFAVAELQGIAFGSVCAAIYWRVFVKGKSRFSAR